MEPTFDAAMLNELACYIEDSSKDDQFFDETKLQWLLFLSDLLAYA